MALVFLFFGWGFITVLNDLLTPILKSAFMLSYFEANFVSFAFFIAYFIGGLLYFISNIIGIKFFTNLGYRGLILLGLKLSGFGCLVFVGATIFKSYLIFLLGLFSIGFGFMFIQIAANPLVLISGDANTGAARLNIAQGFNSLATTLAPIIGAIVFYNMLHVESNYSALKYPYFIFSICFFALAYFVVKFLTTDQTSITISATNKPYALNHLNLLFGAIAIFFYVGSEVGIGANFIALVKSGKIIQASGNVASELLAFYWGGAMIGRFLGGIALNNKYKTSTKLIYMILTAVALTILILQISQSNVNLKYYILHEILAIVILLFAKNSRRTLLLFAFVNIINLIIGIHLGNHLFAIWSIISIGIFNSIMWPNIFDLAIDGLGEYKEQGSSLLIMMILGGAIMPILQGHIADKFDILTSYYVPIIGYVYILLYSIFYSKKTIKLIN